MEQEYETRFQAGQVVAERYTLERFLGEGGVGFVWLAKQSGEMGFSRDVALKFFKQECLTETWMQEALAEIFAVSPQIKHRLVTQFFDSGKFEGFQFLAIEYIGGATLSSLLNTPGVQIPQNLALYWTTEMLKGLGYLHRLRPKNSSLGGFLLHGDISPQNTILESGTGRIVLTDLGVQSTYARSILLNPPLVFGNPWYMPPEQAVAESLMPQSDIYTVGVMLSDLLLGPRLHLNDIGEQELVDLAASGTTIDREKIKTLPSPLAETLLQAVALMPGDRFASADEFGMQLGRYLTETHGFADYEALSLQLLALQAQLTKEHKVEVTHKTNKTSFHESRHRSVPLAPANPLRNTQVTPSREQSTPSSSAEDRRFRHGTVMLSPPTKMGDEVMISELGGATDLLPKKVKRNWYMITVISLISILVACCAFLAVKFWPGRETSEPQASHETSNAQKENKVASNTLIPAQTYATVTTTIPSTPAAEGLLDIKAKPYATISIIGTSIQEQLTPLSAIQLAVGEWKITAQYKNCNVKKAVKIRESHTAVVVFDMKNCK